MMKFIRSRGAHVNAERLKLQKELFQYNQSLFHGFPHRPSALAYDKKLNLLAIGTREGSLRVYGRAGVEFTALIDQERKIDTIIFIDNTSQLLVKCEDNSIHLYEIPNNLTADLNSSELILVKSFEHFVIDLENDEKSGSNRITTLSVHSSHSKIFLATEDGQIHVLTTKNFELDEASSIGLEKVQSQIPNDQPRLLGAAEQILEHPLDPDRLLIGYNRGQLVLWNLATDRLDKFYSSGQQLESVCWSSTDGDEFISSHNDGSYIVWSINDNVQPSQQAKITYGPFPCKPITKIYGKANENLIIFSGGMPRQLHGERHTVSIIQGINDAAKHQVLDLTSKVVDFVVLEQQRALIILVDEELIAIDLNDSEWSQFKLPYLSSVHSSPIMFSQIYSDVPDELVVRLKEIGLKQSIGKHSNREWPVQGGYLKEKVYSPNNVLLITGHENGAVRVWNISDCAMSPLCTINTAKYFGTEDDIAPIDQDEDGDEWPPFKKVGIFDPFSDDPRLGIRRVVLCPKTFNLLVAGTAGQVIVFELKDEAAQLHLTRETVDLVSGLDFIWKSHECLPLEQEPISVEAGYQPRTIVQLNPPASVTALALHTEWGLFAAGTTHGFAVFSYEINKAIAYKCTLNPAEVSNVTGSGNLITRKKSFRKSLRESFRKLRKGRSMRLTKKAGDKSSPVTSPTKSKGSKPEGLDRPTERQVEAKTEDGIGSVVRYLYFANAPIINQGQFQRTLWAGTNAGNVFIYLINDVKEEATSSPAAEAANKSTASDTAAASGNQTEEPAAAAAAEAAQASTANEKKDNEIEESPIDQDKSSPVNLTCLLTKEIQLKHHAPVIFIQIIDSAGNPVLEKPVEEESKAGEQPVASGSRLVRVLICSEEQFKLFNLPTLKPYCKFKLTAQEGAKSRRIHIAKFVSRSDANYSEHCLVNVTNQGDLGIFSILDLKKQLNSKCTKKEDVSGIASVVFANAGGEGVFLNSPSEFSRFSLSALRIVKPNCLISETNLDKIVIETPEPEQPVAAGDQANQSEPAKEQLEEQQATGETPAEPATSNQQSAGQETNSVKPKNADNQTTPSLAKVTEVKTVDEKKPDASPKTKAAKKKEKKEEKKKEERVIDGIAATVPKTIEEPDCSVKLLETDRDCIVKQLCSSPVQLTAQPVLAELKPHSNGLKSGTNLMDVEVDVEVHHNGNGDLKELKNGHRSLADEDEGTGKSLAIDDEPKSEELHLESVKSNGTPTSGVVSIVDDDDPFSDAHDLNSPTLEHARTEVKLIETDAKHVDRHFEQFENNHTKSSKWSNLNEPRDSESANNSTIEHSFNLTAADTDITVDSIKEHFSNLHITNDVDLLGLDTNDGAGGLNFD